MTHLLYISQDGERPSGITTYGWHTLRARADAHMLLLNAQSPPPAAPPEIHARIHCVAEGESHDVQAVARHLRTLTDAMPGEIAVLPNTGDTPWNATVEWLRGMRPADRARFRVLGILHSDVETQYAGAVRHATFAAAWLGVSRRCAAELVRLLAGKVPAAAIYELPYPMPVPPTAATPNLSGPLRLVYAGRLEEPQKRVLRLAAVLDSLARRGLEFAASVVGDGPARAEFAAAIERSAAAGRVSLIGALDPAALAAVLEASDVFLLTSAYEGLPLALLEAMAAGVCPVVMRIDSGLDDVLVHRENGVIVDQGNVAAMTDVVEQLARDRDQLEALKCAARETIAKRFAPEIHFSKLRQIMDRCFAAPPPDPECIGPDPTAEAVQMLITAARTSGRPVVVYGAGMFGRKVVDAALDASLSIAGWVDSDPARSGMCYRGLVCATPETVKRWPDAAFVVGSIEFADEIAKRIQKLEADEPHPPHIVRVRR